jgi:hypothetical protein
MSSEIGLFKLISGEEVITEFKLGEQDSDLAGYYFFQAPRRIYVAQVAPNQFGIKLAPWVVGNPDGAFPVHTSHILTVTDQVTEELKNGYKSETSPLDLSQTNAAAASKLIGG